MFFGLLMFIQVFLTPPQNLAATVDPSKNATSCQRGNAFFGLPTWYKYIKKYDSSCNPVVQLQKQNNTCVQDRNSENYEKNGGKPVCAFDGTPLLQIALAIVDILLRVGALLAVGYVLYGGFLYITSQGEPDGTKRGRQAIVNALVGLVIAIFATAIVTFIGRSVG
jgi:hypothetical protein